MNKRLQLLLKKVLDLIISLDGLVLLTVPFAVIALVIRLNSQGSVFFRQERVGDGRSRCGSSVRWSWGRLSNAWIAMRLKTMLESPAVVGW